MLSQRQLNRALLARQGLLEPFDLPIPRVVEQVGGIQAQYAPSMYVGLWSRMRSLRRAELTAALEKRIVVQGTLLRGTIHLVSREDYWAFAAAIRDATREWFIRVSKGDPAPEELAELERTLAAALAAGTLSQAEVDELVGARARRWMNAALDLVRVPPSGTWERRRADIYADAAWWLGPGTVPVAEARAAIVRRYLAGFGPATPADIASWAGLPVRAVRSALEQVDHVTYRGEDDSTLVDLPDASLPDADTPAPVRFLPTWDATLLVHARRTQILPEQHRPKIFSVKTPFSFNTFLVDGAVAGTWRFTDDHIELTEFEPLPTRVRKSVEHAGEALVAFHR